MSLENQIKKLIEVIELNTKALETYNISKLTTPFSFDKKEEAHTPSINIDIESVKKLAKDKMKQGVDRKDIKKIISDLGSESLSELSPTNLDILYNKLLNMKND